MAEIQNTVAPSARFLGPQVPARGNSPHWWLETRVDYGGPDVGNSRPVVFKRLGLSALTQHATPDVIDTALHGKVSFRSPTLLKAYPSATEGTLSLLTLADGKRVSAKVQGPTSADGLPLIVSPAASRWPDQQLEHSKVGRINFPWMRVGQGRLVVAIAATASNAIAKYLGLKSSGDMLDGVRVDLAGTSSKVLQVELTPEGLEFEADLPDPTFDFNPAGNPTIRAVVRLEITGSGQAALRLVGASVRGDIDAMEGRLASALTALQVAKTPASVRFDARPAVPSIRWLLEEKNGTLRARGNLSQGEWSVLLDETTVGVRIASGAYEPRAVATVGAGTVMLSRAANALTLQVNTREDLHPELVVQFVRQGSHWLPSSTMEDVDVTVDLDLPADQLQALYVQSRASVPGEQPPYIFLPVQDGWLQAPLPPVPEPGDPAASLPVTPLPLEHLPARAEGEPARPTLSGQLLSQGPSFRPGRSLVVESAGHAEVTVIWNKASPADPMEPAQIVVRTWKAAGQLRGYLFAAETSPTAEEAVPNLVAGEAATRDLALVFGVTRSSGRWWDARFTADGGGWKLHFALPGAAREANDWRAWMRDPRAAFVGIVPFTRSVRGSVKPSPSRDLFPLVLTMPVNGGAELLLAEDAFARVPRASYSGRVAFAAEAESLFDTVMPTLPGVQFRPRMPPNAGGGLNRWTWTACWRHGLPALDEFFGSIEVPRRRSDAPVVSRQPLEPAVTALKPADMRRAWLLAADRISLGWVQDRFAFVPWLAAEAAAKPVDVIGWAQPYAWKTTAAISLHLPADPESSATAVPLGSYTLDGVPYSLAGALPGIGAEGVATRFGISENKHLEPQAEGKIGVLGMAIASYDDGGFAMDARGFGVEGRFSRRPGTVQRKAKLVLAADQAASEFSLLTLAQPLRIAASGHMRNELAFYARDLPVVLEGDRYIFDGSANWIESAAGAGGEAFEREHFGRGLHEWRLFEWANGKPMRRYDIGYGPLSFVPLRLWKFQARDAGDGASVTTLWVLGRLELATSSQAWEPGPAIAPFGPEEPYKAGEIFMLKLDDQPLRLEPALVNSVDGPLPGSRFHVPDEYPPGGGMAYVRADAIQIITGGGIADSSDRMPLLLGLQPKQGGIARLHARLFGDDRVLTGTVAQFETDLLVLEFVPPGNLDGVARASTITVRVANKSGLSGPPAWEVSIELGVELRVMSGSTRLFSRSADGAWQWMNLSSGGPSPGNTLRISHESGAISLDITGDSRACEPLLGWPVADLEVRGFLAHVFPAGSDWPRSAAGGALFLEVQGRSESGFLLRHDVNGVTQEVRLDWRTTCTSVIRWPRNLSVHTYAVSSDWVSHPDYVRMVGVPPALPADLPTHVIELGLHDQPIPLDCLGDTNGGFGITSSWTFLAAASHHLKSGEQKLSWHTLDRIEILPATKLTERDDVFEFAPRYRSGKYRAKKTDEKRIPHPGVARSDLAQTGFEDANMPRAFNSSRPVMRGTSVTTFVDDAADIADPQGFVTQVAWLADTATGGALDGVVLAQCHPTLALDWRFASVDAELAAKMLLLHRQQRELPLSADAEAGELDRALRSALHLGAAEIAAQRPVTQAWFEPFDKVKRTPKPMDGLDPAEILFFPETLLVFDKLWRPGEAKLEARTIFAKGDQSGDAVHVRLREPQVPPSTQPHARGGDAVRRTRVDILALDRERVSESAEPLTVPAAAPDNLLGPDGGTGRGRARIRELVKRAMPAPRVIFVRAEVGPKRSAWQVVQMPKPPDDFGARLQVESPRPIPASAALGWPSHEGTADAGKLGPVGNLDAPVVSSRAGLAGRGSTLRLPAWAPGKGGPEALYVSFATHVAFERPAQVVYTGPAARHLSATPARLRAPLSSATREALRKLLGAQDAEQVAVAAICPPALERTSIGDRPGELHAWTASVVVPAEDFGFDPDDVRYGRPAASSPVLARQHRAPRSPLLPADQSLSLRRRTYVSAHDGEVGSGLAEMKLFGVPATLMRLYDDGGEMRCALEIYSGSDEDFRLGDGWDGILQVRLDTAPVQPIVEGDEATTRLCKAGLIPATSTESAAQVRIGNERFPFRKWLYERVPQGAMLTFEMDQGQALQVAASLRATNVDVPVAFDFLLGQQVSSPAAPAARVALAAGLPAAIRTWPVRNLTIPLQRAAGARATLAVDLHTVAFGDAAYDRQLAAPTFESPPTTLLDGTRLVMVADREEYNLDDTVLLTAGVRNDEKRVFAAPAGGALELEAHVQPRRKETDPRPPPLRELHFPDGEKSPVRLFQLTPPNAYALHARSLVEPGGAPAVLEPGDRLVLTVSHAKGTDKEKSCVLMLRLTDLPSISPPASVYSLVTALPFFTRASVAVHACSPLPDALEYPDLVVDLYRGMVQRRALFIWQWSTVEEQAASATLVKVDRSGGAQLPRDTDGFVDMPAGSVRALDFHALMSPFTRG